MTPSLLHLDSSAVRDSESVSRGLSGRFAEIWRAEHPLGGYRYRDLVADPVAPLDTAFTTLARRLERRGLPTTASPYGDSPPTAQPGRLINQALDAAVDTLIEDAAEERTWALTRPLINEVLTADTVLIGAPMYNYSIPAALKAWIDRISFPGAFLDPSNGARLLAMTRFVVITTRGGAYGPGTPREGCDFQQPYLRAYLDKQGIARDNAHFITAEMTMAGVVPHLSSLQSLAEHSLSAAQAKVIALATSINRSDRAAS